MNMPAPYNGNGKYIFVSYSHKDSDKVLPVIDRMIAEGYRVWFDQGIDPGSEWDENIAQHIQNCGYFAVFMSGNYLSSGNCCDELSFARDLEKDRLVIYLEEVDLPSGIAMRINRIQSIHMYKYTDTEMFYSKLFSAQNINCCYALPVAQCESEGEAPQGEQTCSDDEASQESEGNTTDVKEEQEKQSDIPEEKSELYQAKAPQNDAPKGRGFGLAMLIVSAALFVLALVLITSGADFVFSVLSTVASFLSLKSDSKTAIRIVQYIVFALNLLLGFISAILLMGSIGIVYLIIGLLVLVPLWIFLSVRKKQESFPIK